LKIFFAASKSLVLKSFSHSAKEETEKKVTPENQTRHELRLFRRANLINTPLQRGV
jgi:hypothetical protein